MKRLCIATGTRADWGILTPLARALKSVDGIDLQILATNMHLLDRYGHTVDEIEQAGFDVAARVEIPDATESAAEGRAIAMGECAAGSARALGILRPDAIVVLGDRFEMLAVASAAVVMTVPVIHISGGETTGGAIDDRMRHAITQLASLHLVSAAPYAERVAKMTGSRLNIVNTGSLGVWNMVNKPIMNRTEPAENIGIDVKRPFVVATFHAATLDKGASPGERCRAMLGALDYFPELNVIITYPNNDTGSEQIIEAIEQWSARNPHRSSVVKSLGMKRYRSVVQNAELVIGNSSSGIIEVPSLGTPVVNIGIRQQGRLHGPGVIDCADDTESIVGAIRQALSDEFKAIAGRRENPYYQPDSLQKSVDAIKRFLNV